MEINGENKEESHKIIKKMKKNIRILILNNPKITTKNY
jgi:hypothetical protein